MTKLACLGPEGTFSHQAGKKISNQFLMEETIEGVFLSVKEGRAPLGIVPIENSLNGIVLETIDSILKHNLIIRDSFLLKIEHFFASKGNRLEDIDVIKSHPQAIAQCKEWISSNLPNAKIEYSKSSVEGVLREESERVGFILSKEGAKKYALNILEERIEDRDDNFTEFYIISKKRAELIPKRTPLLIIAKDKVGVLKDILSSFARYNLNLTKIHSKSLKDDYYFFIEIDISPDSSILLKVIKEIEDHSLFIRALA